MKRFFSSLATSSLLWGLVATFIYYFALRSGAITNATLVRYSTGHPVEYATIAMFWVGTLDLAFKIFGTRRERRNLKRGALFPPKKREKESLEKVDDYLETLARARDVRGPSIFLTRLENALNFLKFGGAPEELDQELRTLSEEALDERDAEYAAVRAFIWAIPILGFLGTVLGITVALGNLDLSQLEATGDALASGLKVAFDTTALALSLVFVVFFLQFFSHKQDAALEAETQRLANLELQGRFQTEGTNDELQTTRRFLKEVARSFSEATKAQTDLWLESMSSVAKRFADALNQRLNDGATTWSDALAQTQREFVDATLKPSLESVAKSAERAENIAATLARQADALGKVVATSVDVAALEERFARSLEKLAATSEFEKTLSNLSATVCLLNSKLTSAPSEPIVAGRLDDALLRRYAKRDEALAELDSLERSLTVTSELDDDAQTLVLQDFNANESSDDAFENPDATKKRAAPRKKSA